VAWDPTNKRPNGGFKARSFVVVLSDDRNSESLVEDGFERTIATKYRIPCTQTDDVKGTLNK
jgi:hypothetical protein